MYTVRIPVKPYIGEFLKGKFKTENDVVHLDPKVNAYFILYDHLKLRPKQGYVPPAEGVLFSIPRPHQAGKNPACYCYLTVEDVAVLNKVFRNMFWAEAREFMEDCKHRCSIDYNESAQMFLERYGVQSITHWALIKNLKRYRESTRRHVLRSYKFQKNKIFLKKSCRPAR